MQSVVICCIISNIFNITENLIKIIKLTEDNLWVFCRDHAACSKASLTSSTYPGSCKSCFSHKPVFGGKVSLIFLIIYQIAHLHNWPSFPLIFADNTLDTSFNWFGGKNEQFSQFAHRFHRDQTCFGIFDISDIEITQNLYLYLI